MKIVFSVTLLCILEFSPALGAVALQNEAELAKNLSATEAPLALQTDVLADSVPMKNGTIQTFGIPALPQGYHHFPGIGTHKYHHKKQKWNAARNTCLNEGGHLLIISSPEEEKQVRKYITPGGDASEFWIGIHDLFEKDDWVTITGQRLDQIGYVHWRDGEPNNVNNDEFCVTILQGGMNDLSCSQERLFICEIYI